MGEKIVGTHAIEEAIKNAGRGSVLYVARNSGSRIDALVRNAQFTGKITVKKLSKEELERMHPGARGAVLNLVLPGFASKPEVSLSDFCSSLKEGQGALVLILDGITDPHNLGAILRSADQFNADLVIIPERRSVHINETVRKVSSGASHYVKVSTETNLRAAIDKLKSEGFWIYAADMDGEDSYGIEFADRSAIVMGAEGSGVSRNIKINSDYSVKIPMNGHIDSLNVSVAAGILMYEYRRLKNQGDK